MNCFRYFGMKSFDEVDYVLLEEYALLMKSYSLRKLDKERDMHKQAYLNLAVESTDKSGKKTAYPTFEKFFDYDKIYRELFDKEDKPEVKKENKINNMIASSNLKGG